LMMTNEDIEKILFEMDYQIHSFYLSKNIFSLLKKEIQT
jgi:hypothetical protein